MQTAFAESKRISNNRLSTIVGSCRLVKCVVSEGAGFDWNYAIVCPYLGDQNASHSVQNWETTGGHLPLDFVIASCQGYTLPQDCKAEREGR